MIQKLIQHLDQVKYAQQRAALTPIGAGVDVAYEAGRRIGVIQGIDTVMTAIVAFIADSNTKDKEL